MKPLIQKAVKWAIPLLLFTLTVWAYASGGEEEHGGGGMLGLDPKVVVVHIIGFIVVFLTLKKFLFEPVMKVVDARREHIETRLTKIESDRTSMETLKKDYEIRLNNAESEARAKVQDAIKKAETIGEEIKSTKKAEADALVSKAHADVAREYDEAMLNMRKEITQIALSLSGKLINAELDEKKHNALIAQFIDQLDQKKLAA